MLLEAEKAAAVLLAGELQLTKRARARQGLLGLCSAGEEAAKPHLAQLAVPTVS
jgi:hypothetical protein